MPLVCWLSVKWRSRFSVSDRFRPFGAGICIGVYRPMTLVPCGSNRTRVMSRSGHFETGPFCVFYLSPCFPAKNLAPGSLQSDDCQLGGPGASPCLSCFRMTTEGMKLPRGRPSAR